MTDEEGSNGGKHWGQNLSAQCTDQTSQAHTSTFSRCAYGVSSAPSPGSSLTIVYAPDDPTTTATPDGLIINALLFLIGTSLLVPFTRLFLLA